MKRSQPLRHGHSSLQRGVTLIELLIGMAIGVLIMLAVFSVLLNVTQASARVVQTQDVSGAVRASVGYATRRLSEAGFGIVNAGGVLTIIPSAASGAGNSAQFRARTVANPMAAVLPGEIEICTLQATPRANDSAILEEICGGTNRTVMAGTVAFEVHSGCSTGLTTRVSLYRRNECVAGETRRTLRTAILVRASVADPVIGRLVAEDSYTFPATTENPSGAIYTVPTGVNGLSAGCVGDGECRSYKHRLLVTETVPRNELLRMGVLF
jgi:prepilin-type N-terminal cleavage/methylation domain-containing protein